MNIPLSEWSGSGATHELHETIRLQIAATDRQSRVITRLTWFMAVLAFVQTIATVIQVIPIVQGYQDKDTKIKLAETVSKLNKQENQSPSVTHGSTSDAPVQVATPPGQAKNKAN